MSVSITSFTGDEHRWLSNFHPCDIVLDGDHYPSVEHAYQAAKASTLGARAAFRAPSLTCGQAKRLGRKIPLRSDWEQIKIQVMLSLCWWKFSQHPDLRAKLLATGDAHLEEGNRHGDTFWGTVEGRGRNELGKVLMCVRQRLREH